MEGHPMFSSVSNGFRPSHGQTLPFLRNEKQVSGEQPLTNEQFENMTIKYEYQVDTLDLSDKKQKEKFVAILNDIAEGKSVLRHQERQYQKDTKSWLIYLEWAKLFITHEEEEKDGK